MAGKDQGVVEKIKHFVEKTPCTRDSLLYGIAGGLGAGFAVFIFSKHIRRACDATVLSFIGISFGSWEYCRYQMTKEKEEIKKTIDAINEQQRKNRDTNNDDIVRT